MARDSMTGSRIRAWRVARGVRQADLARQVSISPSYLNLIEHNRRGIGGKLLLDIAQALEVDSGLLAEGAEAALLASLGAAAARLPGVAAERDRADEFAGRFPGWAALVAALQDRVGALERTVETLTDRMTHDPHLAASLHEMLSTVTSIRSAASILAEPGEVDPDWQARFHRNIFEDSERLASASLGLVTYLDSGPERHAGSGAPQEEFAAWLQETGFHLPMLEAGATERSLQDLTKGLGSAAAGLAQAWLARYAQDAEALPLPGLARAVTELGADPQDIALHLQAPLPLVMRRLAAAPPGLVPVPVGLAICDASGVVTFAKPLPDFPMPRLGAACPLWPLYRAFGAPGMPVEETIAQAGRPEGGMRALAIAVPLERGRANRPPRLGAQMLVMPLQGVQQTVTETVGQACRICPKRDCAARIEPSVLAATADRFGTT